MLFVQTRNFHEQQALSQQFNREGNLFAIPVKKSNNINILMQNIFFEIFQKNSKQLKQQNNNSLQTQILRKLLQILQNMLKLRISLSQIRQIFELLKISKKKINHYQNYFQLMNEYFCKNDQDDLELRSANNNNINIQINYQIQEYKVNQFRPSSFELFDYQNEFINQHLKNLNSHRSNNNELKVANQPDIISPNQTHTLKSQIFKSPRYCITAISELSDIKDNSRRTNNCGQYKQNQKDGENQLSSCTDYSYILQETTKPQSSNTISSNHYSSNPRNNKLKQLLHISLMSTEPSEKQKDKQKKVNLDQSDFINLSGRVNPVPSFLHDDEQGIKQMIVNEKKQDIRKSNIIKQALNSNQDTGSQASTSDKTYYSNMKFIKLNNKLRKGSRDSLNKKNIKQLNQIKSSIQIECNKGKQQKKNQNPKVPGSATNYNINPSIIPSMNTNLAKSIQKYIGLTRLTSNEKYSCKQIIEQEKEYKQKDTSKRAPKIDPNKDKKQFLFFKLKK